jgi:hypothetical protein
MFSFSLKRDEGVKRAYTIGVVLGFSRSGKPTDNSFVGAFKGKVCAECVDQN